jgi:hypothetical protein
MTSPGMSWMSRNTIIDTKKIVGITRRILLAIYMSMMDGGL